MGRFTTVFAAVSAIAIVVADDFNILQHIGGNGQWLPGTTACDFFRTELIVMQVLK